MDQEDEVICYISIVWLKVSATISIHEERLQNSKAGQKQNETIWNHFKSACFSTQFRVKESFKLLVANKFWKFGDINHATV